MNGDGLVDLLSHVVTVDLQLPSGVTDTTVLLTAQTAAGVAVQVQGTDLIRIVP